MSHLHAYARIGSGTVTAVYDDRWAPLLQGLGALRVERATSVEWNQARQCWTATCRRTGVAIAESTSRAECIRLEVDHLNTELAR